MAKLRYCWWPNCHVKVANGYCDKHNKSRKKDEGRPNSNQRGYDSAWYRVKRRYLNDHPYCENCGEKSQEIHHIVALKEGGDRLSFSNLKALCRICHRRTHGGDNR